MFFELELACFFLCVSILRVPAKWGPQTMAKLVYNSNNYLVYDKYNA